MHYLFCALVHFGESYAFVRRRDVLSRARELLMSDYHNTMLGTGDAQDDEQSSAGVFSARA
jgi:hypothetical protein